MNKRMFIDTVRQYKAAAIRKRLDASTLVEGLLQTRLDTLQAEGVSQAERDKEESWMRGFVAREYQPFVPAVPSSRTD